MSDAPVPKLYLVAPAKPGLGVYPELLGRLIDHYDVACVRISAGEVSEDVLCRTADALRPVCHQRDVPLLLTDHFRLVSRLGLDGVHLSDGSRTVRAARKALARDAIVGAYAHASRHDGMTAGEIGADYVSFGPLTQSSLGDGALAPLELFEWWSELIEVPVVAEGGLTPELAGDLAAVTDFLCLGDELWSDSDGPEVAAERFVLAIAAAAPRD
jgi:thiamine-phosphate pyrophosphorylase